MQAIHARPTTSARDVARAYDRLVSAWWRGEDDAATPVAAWFTAHWTMQAPPEPADAPEAANHLATAGAEIRWYALGEVIVGFVTGRPGGCYRIEAADAVPMVKAPWELPPPERALSDRLIEQRTATQPSPPNRRVKRATPGIATAERAIRPDQDHCLQVDPGPGGRSRDGAASNLTGRAAELSPRRSDAPIPPTPASGDRPGSEVTV